MAQNENNAPDSFAGYADQFRGNHQAIVVPLVDTHPPDDLDDGAFTGIVGAFQTNNPALVQNTGPWYPDYSGIVPVSQQPQLIQPEPWTDDRS